MSTDAQEASIPAQRAAVKQYAATHGYRIIREYVDAGISGDSAEKRPQFLQMIKDAARGGFQAIVCWDQDRFGRFDLMEAGYWTKPLRDAGVQLVTVGQGRIDWTDFAGRLVYSVAQEGKHQFLRDLSKNVNRGKLAKAQAGKWMGGAAPFGYSVKDTTLTIDEEQAATVRLLFRLAADGMTLGAIQRELNRRQIPSPGGITWNRKGVNYILQNEVYLGHIRYNRQTRARYSAVVNGVITARQNTDKSRLNARDAWTFVRDCHPPIITQELFDKAHAGRRSPFASTGGRPSSHVVVFRRLLSCGRCGRAMRALWVPKMQDVVYLCSGHTNSGTCTPNRTYQSSLKARLVDHVRALYLRPSVIKLARNNISASAANDDRPSVAALGRQLRAVQSKVEKAEKRLVEVPPDMIGAVAAQVRELRLQAEGLQADITAAQVPQKSVQSALLAEFDSFIADLRECVATIDDAILSASLRRLVSRISVTSVKREDIGPRGRWEIQSVSATPIIAAFSR